jgi:hypothetical protein
MSSHSSSSSLHRELTFGQRGMKLIIQLVCAVYIIFGIVLMIVGSAALSGTAATITGVTVPEGIVVLGCFLLISAFVGCISAKKESRIGLGFFFISMLIWSIIILSVGIAVYSLKDSVESTISDNWNSAPIEMRRSVQLAGRCCGLAYYNDSMIINKQIVYNGVGAAGPPYPTISNPVVFSPVTGEPITCPNPMDSDVCAGNLNTCQQMKKGGCLPVLSQNYKSALSVAGSCGIAFSSIMFVSLAFTCFLMRAIRHRSMETKGNSQKASDQIDEADSQALDTQVTGGEEEPGTPEPENEV